jgi:hypothetical protein
MPVPATVFKQDFRSPSLPGNVSVVGGIEGDQGLAAPAHLEQQDEVRLEFGEVVGFPVREVDRAAAD